MARDAGIKTTAHTATVDGGCGFGGPLLAACFDPTGNIVDLIEATRNPEAYKLPIRDLIRYGASPRATIFLTMAARANALIEGRGYVTPQDVKTIAPDVLRHRVILTYEAEAEEKSSEDIIEEILANVPVP